MDNKLDTVPDSEVHGAFRPPETLYHYTSSVGLRGVLETGSIWATDLEFLNDEQELRYGLDQLLPILRDRVSECTGSRLASAILDNLSNSQGARHFVACFCEEGDLLSQWRGYASPGGYSLGVRTVDRVDASERDGSVPLYRRVWYDPDDARGFANVWARLACDGFMETFSPVIEALERDSDQPVNNEDLAKRLYEFDAEHYWRLERLCAVLKDPSFIEEKEWRILRSSHPGLKEPPVIEFREGPLGLTPYTKVDLRDEGGLIPIKEVVVGPGPNSRLRISAVKLLLDKLGYPLDTQVRASDVPFRP
jgi:hypothetical protein